MTAAMKVVTVRHVERHRQLPAAPYAVVAQSNCFILIEVSSNPVEPCHGFDAEVGTSTQSISDVMTDVPDRTSWKRLRNDGLLKQ